MIAFLQGVAMNREKRVMDVLSEIGKLLLQHGAETDVVEKGIQKAALNFGYDHVEILVLPNTIMLTLASDGEVHHTKLQRAERQDVNFKALDKVEAMIRGIDGATDIDRLMAALKDETTFGTMYPYYLRNIMAALGCASFSLLFGGDPYIFAVTFLASYAGFYINGLLLRHFFNPFMVIIIVSFTTTMISGLMTLKDDSAHIAISSAILFLVPSVAFINSINDLIKRHYNNGIIRGVRGIIVSFAIAIGMSIALNILGVENFL